MVDLCETFRRQSGRVWNQMGRAPEIGMALSEETLTETALYDIALARQVVGDIDITLATKHQEAKHGADWEWWFVRHGQTIKFRVQAKRLFRDGTYQSLFKPQPAPYAQLDKLVNVSVRDGFKPLFCFFNFEHPAGCQYNWKAGCGHSYRAPSFWGCALADPDDVRAVGSNKLSELAEVMYPWHKLVCRYTEGRDLLDAVTDFVEETGRQSRYPRRSQLIRREMPPEIRRMVETRRDRAPQERYIDEIFRDEAQDRATPGDDPDETAGIAIFDDVR